MKNARINIITGTLIAGAAVGTISLNASTTDLFSYSELGSGSTIRANLLDQEELPSGAYLLELNCGENTDKATDTKKGEDKSKEAKCGEGKCGEGKTGQNKSIEAKKNAKADVKAKSDTTAKETKSKEGKCGEGKCGAE